MACSTRGWEYKCLVREGLYSGLDDDWEGGSYQLLFPSTCQIVEVQQLINVPGTRGTRAMYAEQTVPGNRLVGGRLRFKFGRADLDAWLPRILGAPEATNVFKVANTIPWVQLLVDKGQGKLMEYRDGKVGRATFSGSAGGVVQLDLDLVFKVEEEYAHNWPEEPTYTPSLSTRAIRFAEGGLGIGAGPTAILFDSFSTTIDNLLDPGFYAGSFGATCIDEGKRLVTLQVPAQHTDAAKNLYKQGNDSLAGSLAFTGDNMSTTFAYPCLKWEKRGPVMDDENQKTPVPLNMVAYRTEAGDSGADNEIQVTNDPVYAS